MQQIFASFFNQKFLGNLNHFTLNDRANNFTTDSEKLIAVCYSNRSYSRLKNVPKQENCQFCVEQTEETKHIENKSLNAEFQRYILFFIVVIWLVFWLEVYQLNHSPIQYSGRLLH